MKRFLLITFIVLAAQFVGARAAHAIACSLSVTPTSGPSGTQAKIVWQVIGSGAVYGEVDFGNGDGEIAGGDGTVSRTVYTTYTGGPGTVFDLSLYGEDELRSCIRPTGSNRITFRINGTPPPGNAVCSNGQDDDNDGYTDYPNDCGCSSPDDTTEGNAGQCNNISYSDITIETSPVQSLKWGLYCPPGPYTCNGRQGTGDATPTQMNALCQNGVCAGAGEYSIHSGWGGPNPNPGYDCVGSTDFRPWTRWTEPIYLSLDCAPIPNSPPPTGTNDALCTGHTIPTTMTVGQTVPASVTFQNTGTSTWTQLTPANYDVSLWPWPPTAPSLLPQTSDLSMASVAPGQSMTIPLSITAPAAPGSYAGQYRLLEQNVGWFGSACGSATITVAPAPTLSVSLTATPNTGTAPVNSTLQATPGGTATGTINYSFWWNCANTTTSIAVASAACGALPAPTPGACAGNANGYKCDAVNTVPRSTTQHAYAAGTYTPKVIVERSTAPSAEARSTVTVAGVPPPVAAGVQMTAPNYCGGTAPRQAVSWTYTPGAGAQSAYRVQIAAGPAFNFATPIYDSLKISSTGTTHPTDPLSYNATFRARVMVWDATDTPSAWSGSSATATTPPGPYPSITFTVDPTPPFADQDALFTDTTDYGAFTPTTREWNFGDGTITSESPGTGIIAHLYADPAGITATLRVSTSGMNPGDSCAASQGFQVNKGIPSYKEVRP
ncbi:MAG: hypothetical protein IT406_03600 [Candidatus Yanofskybacteria bacterium]|nr:hypothetical protein [Candidatus Yanofskybacteria bacterium]